MAPSSRYLRPALEASSIPCSTAEGSEPVSDAWCDASDRRCGRTLRHGLQLASGAVGQSFPQVEDLDHGQDAQFLGQTGAAQLLSLMERRWTVSMDDLCVDTHSRAQTGLKWLICRGRSRRRGFTAGAKMRRAAGKEAHANGLSQSELCYYF